MRTPARVPLHPLAYKENLGVSTEIPESDPRHLGGVSAGPLVLVHDRASPATLAYFTARRRQTWLACSAESATLKWPCQRA